MSLLGEIAMAGYVCVLLAIGSIVGVIYGDESRKFWAVVLMLSTAVALAVLAFVWYIVSTVA